MNLFSRKKTIGESAVLHGATDFHSHILPGVDDGMREQEDSLALLRDYEATGLRKLWLTPHIMEDVPNTPDDLRRRFDDFRRAYDGPIELSLAAENMIDPLFEKRLAARDLLPIGSNADHLLVETSYFTPPYNLYEVLSDIMSAGYFPLLAHPERYVYMDREDYLRLKELGVRLQLNVGSLGGFYGETARKKAEWILRADMADAFGSDIHRRSALGTQLDSKIASWAPEKLRAIDTSSL